MGNELKDGKNPIYRKWWFWVIVVVVVVAIFGGTSNNNNQVQKVGETGQVEDNKTVETSTKEEEKKVYGLNEEMSVNKNGKEYTLVITGITEIQERNQFSDKNPAQVFLIDYTYKNIAGDELYISEMNFQIIDEQGEMGESYPGNVTSYPKQTPAGATCKAQMVLCTNNSGHEITLNYKDNMFNSKSDIKFKLNV